MKKTSKCIFSPQLAKYLLQCGYEIIDLKPKRESNNETVFVFKYDRELEKQIEIWKEEWGN